VEIRVICGPFIHPSSFAHISRESAQHLAFSFHIRSIKQVDFEIKFKQSAFRHGVSEADIRYAFTNPRYDGPIEGIPAGNHYIRPGFDTHGNLLEMLYNEYATHVCIFHAMRCRSIFLSLLED
jgi:hypothetical protein